MITFRAGLVKGRVPAMKELKESVLSFGYFANDIIYRSVNERKN